MHNIEDLDNYLKNINNSLIPDGCLITNCYANNTLSELKFTMNISESEREGGISPNVLSFPHVSDIGNTLQRLKFTLPSLFVNKYRFKFHDLSHIFEFLTLTGENNFLKAKRLFKRKDTFISAIAIYQSLFNEKSISKDSDDMRIVNVDLRQEDDNTFVYASFEIATFISWKYHDSQQKSKERGSAEFSLKELASDVLNEDNNKDEDIRFGKIIPVEGKEDEYEIIEMTEKIKNKIKNKLGESYVNEKLKNVKIDDGINKT